ncbi:MULTISPECIES: C40 family peptidase [unclassified Methylobacterium]|uniref:C40 family peptidase n=1 Tax=unclassified Methylobacterium TaxID=2615210 RepID=UPI0006FF102E|nr:MULTISPECIES: C40 family peptidase [unclassified Methylobacterium]KQP61756.1 peptidase P60 [Methylobacterium sp. Leaf108]KQT78444.1 peptidase P60 [Methylobacterium sp. Leaf466]
MTVDRFATTDRRLLPARPDLADHRLRGRITATRYVEGEPRRVLAGSAPLCRGPGRDAGLDTEAQRGEPVTLYEDWEGFSFVQLGSDGYVGYLPSAALGPVDPTPTHRVTALRTFVYPAPDLKQPVLAHLGLGATLALGESEGAYRRIVGGIAADGRLIHDAFVFAAHCAPLEETAADIAGSAERLIGTPYLWGGRTSLGLDCSGLVQLCCSLAGLSVPRDADQQEAALGEALPLDPSGLRRGDLVFWRGHVGIMLDPATLIHANGHHMAVAAEPLDTAMTRIRETSYGAVTSLRRPG